MYAMIVDGNKIAAEIKKELAAKVLTFPEPPTLAIFYDEDNPSGSAYVARKEAFAKDIGVKFSKVAFAPDESTEQIVAKVQQAGKIVDGVIVQLPTPARLDCVQIINAIPHDADVDLLSAESVKHFEGGLTRLTPPVVGAMKIIVDQFRVKLEDAHAVVIGEGHLVGTPSAIWLRKKGARVVTINKSTAGPEVQGIVKEAHILVLGAGSPGLITPDMLHPDVVIFDAGSTIAEGRVKGDANPACAEVASVFTPVPGGIGPLAVACAFQNLIALAEENHQRTRAKRD